MGPSLHLRRMEGEKIDLLLGGLQVSVYMYIVHHYALTIQQYCSYDHQMHQVTLKSFADPIHIVVAMIFHHVLDVLTGSKTQDLSLLVKERSLLLRSKCHQVPVKQWKSRSKKCKNIIGLDLQLESVCQLVSTG